MIPHVIRIITVNGASLWTCPGCKNRWTSTDTEMALRHQANERVEAWHESDDPRPLHEFLGLTWEQYVDLMSPARGQR